MFEKMRNKKGFSLLEMMVVIAIIAVLVGIIYPIAGKSTLQSKAAANAANLRSVEAALSTMRVSNYDAFNTAAADLEAGLGSSLSSAITTRLNGLYDGLGDALKNSLATIEATNGTFTMNIAASPVNVTAPGAEEVKAVGSSGEIYVPKDSNMEIYITENQIIAMYAGYTKEDFADVAEDGTYDAEGKQMSSGEQLVAKVDCVTRGHDYGEENDRHYCARCQYANPAFCNCCQNDGFVDEKGGLTFFGREFGDGDCDVCDHTEREHS